MDWRTCFIVRTKKSEFNSTLILDLYYTGKEIVVEKWERTEIASYVLAEILTIKLEQSLDFLQRFGNWLEEHRSIVVEVKVKT